jgi:hypothetical protein
MVGYDGGLLGIIAEPHERQFGVTACVGEDLPLIIMPYLGPSVRSCPEAIIGAIDLIFWSLMRGVTLQKNRT